METFLRMLFSEQRKDEDGDRARLKMEHFVVLNCMPHLLPMSLGF